jgi:3-dehydroquinate synthase
MSDLKATVSETRNGFHVEGYERIEYDFTFLDGVFDLDNVQLANCYERWGRCLAVMDSNIFNIYGDDMQKYFGHHNLDLKIHKTTIGEKAKSIETLLNIVDSMTNFGIIRKEPVLVVVRQSGLELNYHTNTVQGGGLVTDVAGYKTISGTLALKSSRATC